LGAVRVRFAPSPTGRLHLGGARTALFNWLLARKTGGSFVLRIEDTDFSRGDPSLEASMMEDLRWLGLLWDEGPDVGGPYGPYRQSERGFVYNSFLEELRGKGLVYRCFCSEAELEEERRRRLLEGLPPRYGGRCARLSEEEADRLAAQRPFAWRFRVRGGLCSFVDLVRGEISFRGEELGDFVVVRSDGRPTYNFAAVCDDIAMRITHVVRGEDHLPNTPRQILLYEALGSVPPAFAHLPLVVDRDGRKLSKRDEALSVSSLREMGFLPEAVLNALVLLGWQPPSGEERVLKLEDMVRLFDLSRVSPSPSTFDLATLSRLNRKHLSSASSERIASLLGIELNGELYRALDLLKTEASDLVQLKEAVLLLQGRPPLGPKPRWADGLVERLLELEPWGPEEIGKAISSAASSLGVRTRELFEGLRLWLLGREEGLPICLMLFLLGKQRLAGLTRGPYRD